MKPHHAVLLPAMLAVMPSYGQTAIDEQSENVLVTATRLDDYNSKALGHVSVISAADIRNSTARTLPELLARESGVITRSLYGNNGTGATVDIRGFGAAWPEPC